MYPDTPNKADPNFSVRGVGNPTGRVLCRQGDGTLYDTREQRTVTMGELVFEVRTGKRFHAYNRLTGLDCTYRTLAAVIAEGTALLSTAFQ
ncbi:hypothetical protein LKL35_35855 [Streptomyces sp. ET3-23]|uniref:polyhydroxyalkanoate synthesis regulator DNA-binding domain-containing protein n=1 Tax=Streptomyces sp. ET3-23 TaxID=2885643 RepID=UPI001D11BA41|nr:polyhydroxyalkanoate synthesis regulator DNA-binding domain-containing protein [Streptomyces sp. ET3-23]MCC2280722.1 hypothetical protein [Streptomyces sp. ET3-23]